MQDVLGRALYDYHHKKVRHKLWIHNRYGSKEEMPVEVYFRTIKNMSPIELIAMEGCTGNTLDIGAAAGCHSLILQQRNINVTALDISSGAIEVLRKRGIKKIIEADIFSYNNKQFDTLLLLMNGIGIAGTITRLEQLLQSFSKILKPGGHILFDSSDVKYLYLNKKLPENYYGEIEYRYEYNNEFSEWFKWLYIDQTTMHNMALNCGLNMQVLLKENTGIYLGRLTKL